MSSMLPNLSALTLEIEAKEKKQKAKSGQTPYAKPAYVDIPLKQFDDEDKPEPTIRTRNGGPNATQAERTWLRQEYGNNWSAVLPAQKEIMKTQARKVLAQQFAPILEDHLANAESVFNSKFQTDNYNASGLVILDFVTDLIPFLNEKHPPDWRKSEDGSWLDQTGKDARIADGKREWRVKREEVLQAKKALEWAELREKILAEKIEDLQNPDEKGVRRARALLRHWFNRPGTDGKKRDWRNSVDTTTSKKRLAWAKAVVLAYGYDHTNPPQPPEDLYTPGDVNTHDDKSFLPDPVETVSSQGGQWVWKYMRALSNSNIETTQSYEGLQTVEEALRYWDPSFRAQQMQTIRDQYSDFIESLNDMPKLPGAKDVAMSYTIGSGKFNKYILYPSSKIEGDPQKIPLYGAGGGGVAGSMLSGDIGPPDLLHRLYKLIKRCPRLQEPCYFVRGVNSQRELPHNLGKSELVDPVVGRGYLNVTFMSTSSADPSSYTSDFALTNFYNTSSKCCLYIITAPKGTPVLPLVLGGTSTSAYASEQEVMFPPGLVLVFQGTSQQQVGSDTTTVHFYEVRRPPKVPLPDASHSYSFDV